MQLFLLDRNTNQNHEIEHISPLPRSKGENPNLNQKDQQFIEVESFSKKVSTDYEAPGKPELRSDQDGQDIAAESLEGLTQTDFVNQNQPPGPFTQSKSEAETASFKDSQDFLAIVSQLNKTLENIKNQERIIRKGQTIYPSLYVILFGNTTSGRIFLPSTHDILKIV